MNIDNLFEIAKNRQTDINEHLETLKSYASKVNHVTELGVREGNSTVAFLAGKPRFLVSYDINPCGNRTLIAEATIKSGVQWFFLQENSLTCEIMPTDLLFIDTEHNYEQLIQELNRHNTKVSKYIILHDTETYKHVGDPANKGGLLKAINEFLDANKSWSVKEVFTNNNGLTVLEKKDE